MSFPSIVGDISSFGDELAAKVCNLDEIAQFLMFVSVEFGFACVCFVRLNSLFENLFLLKVFWLNLRFG